MTHHLKNLPIGSLGRSFLDLQMEDRSLGGLFYEVEEDLEKLGNPDLTSVTKTRFRKMVRDYIGNKNRLDLLEEIKSYKKLNHEKLKESKNERKKYFPH